MKRIIVFVTLFSFLSVSTSFGEMVKVPFLFNHFNEHKNENNDITFINFLFQHYMEESDADLQDPDFSEDSKLPFKADETIHTHIAPFILNSFKQNTVLISENIFFVEVDYQPVFSFSPQIWQPPRLI
jgi:hypothetical protein